MPHMLRRHIGKVRLRQRWLEGSHGDLVNSRRIEAARISHDGDHRTRINDREAPAPSGNLLLIVDILLIASLGKFMQEGWLAIIDALESEEAGDLAWKDLGQIFVGFFGSFFRPLSPLVFMWMFANLIMGWFYLENNPMPLEYGGGDKSYKTSEFVLLPTMLCMLLLSYNSPVCILTYARSFSIKQVWNQTSEHCGYLKLSGNMTVTTEPSYFPPQPCSDLTWGSCAFCTAAHIVFKIFALAVLWYILHDLTHHDRKASRRVLHVFIGTQTLGLCVRVATFYKQLEVLYEGGIPSRESAAYWPCLVMYNIAGFLDFAPFWWMGFIDMVGMKYYCLPLDSDFLKGRMATLFRVALSNMLLVGFQAGFHNGTVLGDDKKYHSDLEHNLLGIFLPLTVWGTKMLYFDSVGASPSLLATYNTRNRHAVDSGFCRAIVWFSLQITAVGCSGMVSQCLVSILKRGQYATRNEVRMQSLAFAAFVFSLAGLAFTHDYKDALRYRQKRRVLVRCLFATSMLLTAVLGPRDKEYASLSTWLSVLGICGCALTERSLDQRCPHDKGFDKEKPLLQDAEKGNGIEWRCKHPPSRVQTIETLEDKLQELQEEEEEEPCAVTAVVGDEGILLGYADVGDAGNDDGGDLDCHDCDGGHF